MNLINETVQKIRQSRCLDCESCNTRNFFFKEHLYQKCQNCSEIKVVCPFCTSNFRSLQALSNHKKNHIYSHDYKIIKYNKCQFCLIMLLNNHEEHLLSHFKDSFLIGKYGFKKKRTRDIEIETNFENSPNSPILFQSNLSINNENQNNIFEEPNIILSFDIEHAESSSEYDFNCPQVINLFENNPIKTKEAYIWIMTWIDIVDSERSINQQLLNLQQTSPELASKLPLSSHYLNQLLQKFLPPQAHIGAISLLSLFHNIITSQSVQNLIFEFIPPKNGIIQHFCNTDLWKSCVEDAKIDKSIAIAYLHYSDEFVKGDIKIDGQKIKILNFKESKFFSLAFNKYTKNHTMETRYKSFYNEIVHLRSFITVSNMYGSLKQYRFIFYPIIAQYADMAQLNSIGLQKNSNCNFADIFTIYSKNKFSLVKPFFDIKNKYLRKTIDEKTNYDKLLKYKLEERTDKALKLITKISNTTSLQFIIYPFSQPRKENKSIHKYLQEMYEFNRKKRGYERNLNNLRFPLLSIFNTITENGRDLIISDNEHVMYKNALIQDHIILTMSKLSYEELLLLSNELLLKNKTFDLTLLKLWKMESYHDLVYIIIEVLSLNNFNVDITNLWILECNIQKETRKKHITESFVPNMLNLIIDFRNKIRSVYSNELKNNIITFNRPKLTQQIHIIKKIGLIGGHSPINGLLAEREWKKPKEVLSHYNNHIYLMKRFIEKETLELKCVPIIEITDMKKNIRIEKYDSITKYQINLNQSNSSLYQLLFENDLLIDLNFIFIRGIKLVPNDIIEFFDYSKKKEKYGKIKQLVLIKNERNLAMFLIIQKLKLSNFKNLKKFEEKEEIIKIYHTWKYEVFIHKARVISFENILLINQYFY